MSDIITDTEPPERPEEGPAENDYTYPWVVAWGRLIAMTEDQIDRMVHRARRENAPHIATFKYTDFDDWDTLDRVTRPETRYWLLDYARTFDLQIPEEVMAHWLDPDYPHDHDTL